MQVYHLHDTYLYWHHVRELEGAIVVWLTSAIGRVPGCLCLFTSTNQLATTQCILDVQYPSTTYSITRYMHGGAIRDSILPNMTGGC